ncbi:MULTISPECIES: porin [unclassified Ruegeria]|uniref:porin n=1 Tax=unclassified Ruegeria TaxID=2625375 RepID=UPI001491F5BD|nr:MULTISPECIES: porin [unclassified Ruegeria]NOD49188.1 porin [Ruegeria sp. HKCCD5849]NOD51752.1 porin [Ruegeria sp. HKCCD5851]NOD68738.1 porin [Ruegeria sp. HKCCD7303]
MKKVLFASTALIATAGVAAAEVNFSGYGRFGIGYVEDRVGAVTNISTSGGVITTINTAVVDTDDAILVSRFRLNIDGIVETDGGVRFEGRVRLQADEDSSTGEANSAGLNGARFSVIYGGLRVDAGNVAGAFDNLANYYGNEVGLELFAGQYSGVNYSFLGYSSTGSGSNAVFFQYAVGDFAFGASYDQATIGINGVATDADRWDISATYTFNNITAAVAYGQTDAGVSGVSDPSLTVLTLGAEFGDFSGTLFVADDATEIAATDGTAWGLSAAYNLGAATTLLFTYGDGNADADLQQVAIGAIYDLGGGASLRGGIGVNDCDICADSTIVADFGAQFNF